MADEAKPKPKLPAKIKSGYDYVAQLAKLASLALLIGTIVFLFFVRVEMREDEEGNQAMKFVWRRMATIGENGSTTSQAPVDESALQRLVAFRPTSPGSLTGGVAPIRIATFQLGGADDSIMSRPQVRNLLGSLFVQFDIVAVQGIRSRNETVLAHVVQQLNEQSSNRTFDYATLSPTLREGNGEYSAFLFDTRRIEIDRAALCQIEDPMRRLAHRPLVGLFRVRGPKPNEAFTFKLVNINVDPRRRQPEAQLIDDIYWAAQRSVPATEDDIILLGDLGMDEGTLEDFGQKTGLKTCAGGVVDDSGTITRRNELLLEHFATVEFTGRAERISLRKMIDSLGGMQSPPEAMVTASPLWAQFSAYEGGRAGDYLDRTTSTSDGVIR